MFEKKFGLGLAGAAALAACSPAEKAPDSIGLDTPEAASVMRVNGENIELLFHKRVL